MRGRGLKPDIKGNMAINKLSLPMRGRGLKQILTAIQDGNDGIAPHTGAWIDYYEGITKKFSRMNLRKQCI